MARYRRKNYAIRLFLTLAWLLCFLLAVSGVMAADRALSEAQSMWAYAGCIFVFAILNFVTWYED